MASDNFTGIEIGTEEFKKGDPSHLNRVLTLLAKRIQGLESASSAPASSSSSSTSITNITDVSTLGFVEVTSSSYNLEDTRTVVLLSPGASNVFLPSSSSVGRNVVIFINDSGGSVTLVPATGDSIEGASSYVVQDGSIYQMVPSSP